MRVAGGSSIVLLLLLVMVACADKEAFSAPEMMQQRSDHTQGTCISAAWAEAADRQADADGARHLLLPFTLQETISCISKQVLLGEAPSGQTEVYSGAGNLHRQKGAVALT